MFPTPSCRSRRKEKGILLFIVSVIILILALGGVSLLLLMRTEHEAALLRSEELQLTGSVRSAVALIKQIVDLPPDQKKEKGGICDNPALFRNIAIANSQNGPDTSVSFTIFAPRFNKEKIEGIRFGLVNESTKLNLGALLRWDRESPGTGKKILMKLPGITASEADSILDWIDPDENPRDQGAESVWYESQKRPYRPRNALPVFLEELLLVRDIERKQLFGSNENRLFDLAAKSESDNDFTLPAGENGENEEAIPWNQLLTVFSAEKDLDPNGEPRIDLNEKNLEFLHGELVRRLDPDLANFIIHYRQYGPSKKQNAPATTSAQKTEKPNFNLPGKFLFRTPLDLVGSAVLLPNGTRWDSPIPDEEQNAQKLMHFLDFASVGESALFFGRININESSRIVLECIPGLTDADVQRILSERPGPDQYGSENFRHSAWIYTKKIVDLEKMKDLWSKTTSGGDVYRAEIIASLANRGSGIRAEVVVDSTVNPPRQAFYKEK
ncbi:MAG: type II secretion system protein GspK [Planctomycetia bacterium]|nr:type II secretion system protein GspK [Planctomycetia bacterium]